MGSPLYGNQFWKFRSTHGVEKTFKDPKKLWESACQYFKFCQENPIKSKEYVGKDAKEVIIEKPQPFTMAGLCIFLGVNTVYFNQFEENVASLTEKQKEGFTKVIQGIRDTIFVQKFNAAAAGLLNANLISRELGMVDRKDITTKDKPLPAGQIVVADSETIKAISKQLEEDN